MTQADPTLRELWAMIERDSQNTRVQVQNALTEVRERLGAFVTKEVWEAEKRALERRLDDAEEALQAQAERHERLKEKLEREARDAARARRQDGRDFLYKGVIPVLALLVAAVSVIAGLR